jgi:hypothetical protein
MVGGASYATFRYVKVNTFDAYPRIARTGYAFDRCYPSTSRSPLRVSKFVHGKVTYWEVEAQSQNPRTYAKELQHFRTEGSKCKWLNRNRVTFRLDYMPENAAVGLAKMYFEPMLLTCITYNKVQKDPRSFCVDDMQLGLSGTSSSPRVLFPEEVKALQSLGLQPNLIRNVRLISRSSDIRADAF